MTRRMLHEARAVEECSSPVVSSFHAGKKAAAAARVSRTAEAASILEAMAGGQADATVTIKATKKTNKADKAVAAKKGKKGKRGASAVKEVAETKDAATKAAAAAAAGKPRTPSRRTRKPCAVVVGSPRHTCLPSLCKHCRRRFHPR